MKTTWQQLLDLEPNLRQWQDDARSIASEARWNWYGRWLPHFAEFRRDLHRLAERHGLDFSEIHSTAVAALLDVYDVARARQDRQRRKEKKR